MFDHLRSLAVQQLDRLDDSTRLVVVHPNYAQQHLIMAEFLNQPVAYVRFEGTRLSTQDLKEQFETAMHGMTDYEVIILDECDRAAPGAMDDLLIDLMRQEARLVMFTRDIPHCVLDNPETRRQSAFIPHESTAMLWNYAQRKNEVTLLEVRALGEGHVLLNGKRVNDWDGVLPRSLFFYLVDRGMTTRNEIFETFWPNLPTREATNVFHVTKRKISEVLGLDLTTYWSGFYRLSSEVNLSYDVVLFSEMLQNSAVLPPVEAEEPLKRAIGLYRGQFLSNIDMEWSRRRRQELSQDYGEALITLAKAKEAGNEKEEALGLYLRAAAHNRHREDVTSSIMMLYHEQGQSADALAAYDRLSTDLESDLGVLPSQPLQRLAEDIQQALA